MMSLPKNLRLQFAPSDLRTIDPVSARDIAAGRFVMAGQAREYGNKNPFIDYAAEKSWSCALHSFVWLRHLRALDNASAKTTARRLVRLWLEEQNTYESFVSEPEIALRRLYAFLAHSPIILEDAEAHFYENFLEYILLESIKLQLIAEKSKDSYITLPSWIVLLILSICLNQTDALISQKEEALIQTIALNTHPQGGLASRNAHQALELLSLMLPLRQCYHMLDRAFPQSCNDFIEMLIKFLSFMRLSDGSLARFHGVGATPIDLLSATLASTPTTYHDDLEHIQIQCEFAKIVTPHLSILADIGSMVPAHAQKHYTGPSLGFELSTGFSPLIVCSGTKYEGLHFSYPHKNPEWISTLIPEKSEKNHALVPSNMKAKVISCQKTKELFELCAQHNGYLNSHGFEHQREWKIDAQKSTITISDQLIFEQHLKDNHEQAIELRFILHPSVEVGLRPRSIVLTTSQREKWRITAKGAKLELEPTTFNAVPEGHRATIALKATATLKHQQSLTVTIKKMSTED